MSIPPGFHAYKPFLTIFGYLSSVACSIVLFVSFLIAKFVHNNKLSVNLNIFGESNIELVVFSATFIIIIMASYFYIQDFMKTKQVKS